MRSKIGAVLLAALLVVGAVPALAQRDGADPAPAVELAPIADCSELETAISTARGHAVGTIAGWVYPKDRRQASVERSVSALNLGYEGNRIVAAHFATEDTDPRLGDLEVGQCAALVADIYEPGINTWIRPGS